MTVTVLPRPAPEPSARTVRMRRTADLLGRAAANDDPLRTSLQNTVVELNVEVAQSIAARFRDRGETLADLEQAACVGLVKAVRGFQVDQGHDFLSYAVPTITGEVKRHFRDTAWSVRPPRRIQELQGRVFKAWARLAQQLERDPRAADVAHHLGVDEAAVIEALTCDGCFRSASLDSPVEAGGDSASPLGSLLGEGDDGHAMVETLTALLPAIDALSDSSRLLLRLIVQEGWTQQRVADHLSVSQMHVSRHLARVRRELHTALEAA